MPRLQPILGVAKDAQRNTQDEQSGEANKLWHPIDPNMTTCGKKFPDTQDLPVTYDNVNPVQRKLLHRYFGRYMILWICGYEAELDLPHNTTIYVTVTVGRLKVDPTSGSRIVWPPPTLPVWASRAAPVMSSNELRITAQAPSEPFGNTKWNLKVATKTITHGSQKRIWHKHKKCWTSIGRKQAGSQKRREMCEGRHEGQFVLSFWIVERHHEGIFNFGWRYCILSRGFSKMIAECSDIGGWLCSGYGVALLH